MDASPGAPNATGTLLQPVRRGENPPLAGDQQGLVQGICQDWEGVGSRFLTPALGQSCPRPRHPQTSLEQYLDPKSTIKLIFSMRHKFKLILQHSC